MASKDYIKLYRSLLDWEWFTDGNVLRLWVYILLRANWKDAKFQGEVIERGSFVTSYSHMSEETGLSIREIRTALSKLEQTGEISRKSTNKRQTITVEKYEFMQSIDVQSDNQETNERQTNDKQTTTIEEYKEGKNKKNNKKKEVTINNNSYICHPDVTEVKAYIIEKGYHFSAENFVAHYESNGWKVGKNPMKSWKAACVTWESNWKKKHQLEGKSWLEVAADLERKIGDETTKE